MDRLSRATRIYERILLIYPAPYRARFGREMTQNFRDLYRDETRRGEAGGGFWMRTVGDLGAGALAQYASVIRSQTEMRQYFSNNADEGALVWGFVLMVPAGVFFVLAAGVQHIAPGVMQGLYAAPIGRWLPIFLIGLPLLAVAINLAPLAAKALEVKDRAFSLAFARRNFWSIALALVGLLWLGFLFGHDTIGCAAHFLPLLQFQAFQHCALTH